MAQAEGETDLIRGAGNAVSITDGPSASQVKEQSSALMKSGTINADSR